VRIGMMKAPFLLGLATTGDGASSGPKPFWSQPWHGLPVFMAQSGIEGVS